MNIRPMTIDDYEQVRGLWLDAKIELNDTDDSREGIKKYIDRNPNTSFVAEKDGKIVGATLSGHDGRRGFIWHTAVAESCRRQGVAKALAETAEAALAREGIRKAALVVFETNEKGNEFWEKAGFEKRTDLIYRNKIIK